MVELFSQKDALAYTIAFEFHQFIHQELDGANSFFDNQEFEEFSKYYRKLMEIKAHRIARAHYYASRLADIISLIQSSEGKVHLLDAGCGVGSESILFSLLGARVYSLDLKAARLSVAKRRLCFYEEKVRRKLSVDFRCQNVFELSQSDSFDIIWANESISHIHPAEKFLELAYDLLRNKGNLVICDSNAFNPVVWLRAFREHGFDYHSTFKDHTGREVEYAVERLFTPWKLKKMLIDSGFLIENVTLSTFLPPSVIAKLNLDASRKIENALNKIPFIRALAGVYTIIARKDV